MKNFFEQIEKMGRMEGFYNTTKEEGAQLELFKNKALNQNDAIFRMFAMYGQLSASQCHKKIEDYTHLKWILTSVRRSITTLAKAGKLEKTSNKVEGLYGRPECVYILCNASSV